MGSIRFLMLRSMRRTTLPSSFSLPTNQYEVIRSGECAGKELKISGEVVRALTFVYFLAL